MKRNSLDFDQGNQQGPAGRFQSASNSEANLRDKRQKLAGNHDAGKWFGFIMFNL